jgi:hypothetical protein
LLLKEKEAIYSTIFLANSANQLGIEYIGKSSLSLADVKFVFLGLRETVTHPERGP